MRGRSTIMACCILLAGEAAALSCARVTIEDAYENASQSEATYHVVEGTFAFDGKRAPSSSGLLGGQPPESEELPARFEGLALSEDGFTTEVETDVTVAITCAGPWCGGIAPDTPMIAFLRVEDNGLILEATPCGGWAFDNPDDGMRQTLLGCIDGSCQ